MERRRTFDEVAELYDRARPGYPQAVFDDLAALGELPAGARVLEIGPGTGQATVELARRGYAVTAVELGAGLAAVARRKLAPLAAATVITADFELWTPPAGATYDAVVAFTAFHWLREEIRFAKPAALLAPSGVLAVVSSQHVLPDGGDTFWIEVQEDYDAVVPGDANDPPPPPDAIASLEPAIKASGLFRSVAVRRYLWDVGYDAEAYLAVLDTYSGHRALPDERRRELYRRIRRRIQARAEPVVTKTYLTTMDVARRVD